MGDHVFLKVMPKREVVNFDKRGKISLRFIEPFKVLKMVGTIACPLALCSCGIPCLHAPEVHSRFDSCGGLGQACC